ncbi:MAG: undecaprenyl-diphosphatase, partial [Clostridia bacterium]|nr:undecaprenyl-diphosphatase [Clostridia bacterium]
MMPIDFIKSILLGIVEGISEWLPISSTGHMILMNEFMKTKDSFLTTDVFLYVIQLGAILAIVTLFFNKLNPFSPRKSKEEKKDTFKMWFKV